jgi:hypothetical protein
VVEWRELEDAHRWQLGNTVNQPWDAKRKAWSPQIEGKTATPDGNDDVVGKIRKSSAVHAKNREPIKMKEGCRWSAKN